MLGTVWHCGWHAPLLVRWGFYLMDEPDAPLSFTASLGLAALLHDLAAAGAQAVVATHSPIVAAIPGPLLRVLRVPYRTP